MRFCELSEKEVICCSTGARLGFAEDMIINAITGQVEAIVVPTGGKLLGLFGQGEEVVVNWCDIDRIGEDIILVNSNAESCFKNAARNRARR